jgi:thiamine biosynthesis lipoprotein
MKINYRVMKIFFTLLMVSAMLWAGIHYASFFAPLKTDPKGGKNRPLSDKTSFPAQNIKPGWWESSGLIYFQIPARILFKLENASEDRAETISKQAWAEFDRIGKIFNPFDPFSEVSALNSANKTGQVRISSDMFDVLTISQEIWRASQGHFDPTLMRIKNLWRNAEKIQQIPSDKEIALELAASGLDKVHISSEPVIQVNQPGIMFDFGGIVKGYAVDRVRELLIAGGASSCLVQLGGEISTFGDNDGISWRIGIQHPRRTDRIWGIASAPGRFNVSTSGNYMQPIMIQGRSFYHIFNPKTGKPVSEKILGVTVSSSDGKVSNAVLDGSATAITVLGPRAGLEFAQKTGIDALILFEKKDKVTGEIATPGFCYEKAENEN